MSPFSGQYCLPTALWGPLWRVGVRPGTHCSRETPALGSRWGGWTWTTATQLGYPSAHSCFTRLSYRRFVLLIGLDLGRCLCVSVSVCMSSTRPGRWPQEVGPGLSPGSSGSSGAQGHECVACLLQAGACGKETPSPRPHETLPQVPQTRVPNPEGTEGTMPRMPHHGHGLLPNQPWEHRPTGTPKETVVSRMEKKTWTERRCSKEQVHLGTHQRWGHCSPGAIAAPRAAAFWPSSASATHLDEPCRL